eukprot:TRINITY_DN120880_c0_g1_i1.p1 TRINITY_DN120880_c0_g1~~TRINITY_DN120880_c0_g1_i1.p1  ORF type:complete len:651 (-),score=144.97 TRINITY_DN120880_c0_g1_i1:87-2039(-)
MAEEDGAVVAPALLTAHLSTCAAYDQYKDGQNGVAIGLGCQVEPIERHHQQQPAALRYRREGGLGSPCGFGAGRDASADGISIGHSLLNRRPGNLSLDFNAVPSSRSPITPGSTDRPRRSGSLDSTPNYRRPTRSSSLQSKSPRRRMPTDTTLCSTPRLMQRVRSGQSMDLLTPRSLARAVSPLSASGSDFCFGTRPTFHHAYALARKVETKLAMTEDVAFPDAAGQLVHQSLRESLLVAGDVVKALEEQVACLEGTSRKVAEFIPRVRRAHSTKLVPLSMCCKRLEIRQSRPEPFREQDAWHESLVEEQRMYATVREELADLLASSKTLLRRLENSKLDVLDSLHSNRRLRKVDRIAFLEGVQRRDICTPTNSAPSSPSCEAISEVSGAPRVLPRAADSWITDKVKTSIESPRSASASTAPPASMCSPGACSTSSQPAERAKAAMDKSAEVLLLAESHIAQGKEVLDRLEEHCQRVSYRTLSHMTEKLASQVSAKKALEERIYEIDRLIEVSQRSVQKTGKHMKRQALPEKLINRQTSIRQVSSPLEARSLRKALAAAPGNSERSRDEVDDKLEQHMQAVKETISSLSTQLGGTTTLIEEMKAEKQQLSDELKLRVATLRVDNACTKVTQNNVSLPPEKLAPTLKSACA